MGCGGSKEEVATGNTVSTAARRLLQRKSDTAKAETTPSSTQKADVNPVSDNAEPCKVDETPSTPTSSPSSAQIVAVAAETCKGDEPPPPVSTGGETAPSSPPSATQKAGIEDMGDEPLPLAANEVKGETTNSEVKEGKVVSRDSPNRYFSPRKEEAATNRRMGSEGAEYYSPPPEPEPEPEVEKNGAENELGERVEACVLAAAAEVVKEEEKCLESECGEVIATKQEEGETNSKDAGDSKAFVEEQGSEATSVENKTVGEGEKTDVLTN